ncbi:MAG TPA: glycosyltransferase [Candidatus Baltobacteraceae bacterium]|nr:glycosyltransferase [Candidatus Baltobacteraceae bacterium]
MKRLLQIAHVFPPAPSPGALRPGYLSRYLPNFGWDVVTVTASAGTTPFPARVISTAAPSNGLEERLRARVAARSASPDAPLRRFLRAAKENVLFPDTTAPWIPGALRAGMELLEREHFDAILSTAHPPSVHVIGWLLARKSGLPWIADYRDPWAGNAYLKRPLLRQLAEEFLERGMIHRANAVTTISEPIAAQLRRFHRRRDVYVIPNAFDPADWAQIPSVAPSRFDLTFTGSMYDGKRSPALLFAALESLRREGHPAGMEARVHFYGPNSDNVGTCAAEYNVSLIVRQHGVVPRQSAMRAQRSSAGLLIFLNMDPLTAGEMGSKYLEYLGAQRPILAFGPQSSVMRSFIERNDAGWFASDVEEAKRALVAAHENYTRGTWRQLADTAEAPTAHSMAFRFAELLDRAAPSADLERAV